MVSEINKTLIYQVYAGRWEGRYEGNRIIKVSTFQDLCRYDWKRLIPLGFTTIYLLGIFEAKSPIVVNEENGFPLPPERYPRVSSPFAITNHKNLNPFFGSEEDFKKLISLLHDTGLHIIIDFVPNHTAVNHLWTMEHPEYYHHHNGDIVREFSGDVAKLNYSNPALCQEMISILHWIAALGADGVRCDMAHLVPTLFWQEAIANVRQKYKNFMFIAEAYPESLFNYDQIHALYTAGFDAIYNNGMYENLKKVLVNNEPLEYLKDYLQALPQLHPGYPVNYFANHDDPPLDNKQGNTELSETAQQQLEAMVALILFTPGIGFIYNGTLLGKTTRLAHHWFEPLDKMYLETENPLPQSLESLFIVRKRNHQSIPTDTSIEVSNNLLVLRFGALKVALNLTSLPQTLTAVASGTGSVHMLKETDYLQPGKAEVWSV